MELAILVGFLAGTLTTIAFIPQLIKVWTTRSTKDISLATFIIFCFGLASWLAYGVLLGSLPLILANIAQLAFALAILFLKLKNG